MLEMMSPNAVNTMPAINNGPFISLMEYASNSPKGEEVGADVGLSVGDGVGAEVGENVGRDVVGGCVGVCVVGGYVGDVGDGVVGAVGLLDGDFVVGLFVGGLVVGSEVGENVGFGDVGDGDKSGAVFGGSVLHVLLI